LNGFKGLTGGGYLKDLYTTYTQLQLLSEDGMATLSPPDFSFLQPGLPGLRGKVVEPKTQEIQNIVNDLDGPVPQKIAEWIIGFTYCGKWDRSQTKKLR